MIPNSRLARTLCGLTGMAGAAAVLAACGSTAPSAAPTKTITVTPSSAATTPASTATPATTSTPDGPPGCASTALSPRLGVSQGTAGTIYQVVVLTNTSSATCTLYGYPGVSFVTGSGGSQIGAPATRNNVVTPALVTLAGGATANFLLGVHEAGAYPPSECQLTSVDWLRIYAPGDTGALYLQYKTQACGKASLSIMNVTVVRAGAGSASY
jgi:hypothetical protein